MHDWKWVDKNTGKYASGDFVFHDDNTKRLKPGMCPEETVEDAAAAAAGAAMGAMGATGAAGAAALPKADGGAPSLHAIANPTGNGMQRVRRNTSIVRGPSAGRGRSAWVRHSGGSFVHTVAYPFGKTAQDTVGEQTRKALVRTTE